MAKVITPTFLQFTLPDGKKWALDDALIYSIWEKTPEVTGIEIGEHVIVDVLCSYETVLETLNHIDLTTERPELDVEFTPETSDNIVTL